MPVNLELKAKITSPSRILQTLQKLGRASESLLQTDTYFRFKNGRLKLREFCNGKAELIFYHRNEKKGRRCSNYSILSISDTKKTKEFLKRAFCIDVVVRKSRLVYYYKGQARIHLDRIKKLGMFIEFEVFLKRDRKKSILLFN